MADDSTARVTIKNISVFEIKNAREYKGTIFFTIYGGGLYISGCRIAKGKNGEFISWPQQKGKDDKYYTIARLYMSEEAESNLIAKVKTEANAGKNVFYD